MTTDRNFDDLALRFKRNIYGSLKGRIRLAILERDLAEHISDWRGLRVLDAGCGQGHFSLGLAERGAEVVLNDISAAMLQMADDQMREKDAIEGDSIHSRVRLIHSPIQELDRHLTSDDEKGFDVVLCHAVIEWLAEPEDIFLALTRWLKPGGILSLIFYNFHGLAFKNLLRTNFYKFDYQNFKSFRGSLTPTNPLDPEVVEGWLSKMGLEVKGRSGIRVFHDYILNREERERDPEGILAKEIEYSKRDPYWQMARYIHFVCGAG